MSEEGEVGIDLDAADARAIHDGEVGVALEAPGRTPGVLNDEVVSLDRVKTVANSSVPQLWELRIPPE